MPPLFSSQRINACLGITTLREPNLTAGMVPLRIPWYTTPREQRSNWRASSGVKTNCSLVFGTTNLRLYFFKGIVDTIEIIKLRNGLEAIEELADS